ncbi:18132_t:CDS:2 [Funneliformis geosporum]|nr:18132_t:CDS:2 [Funneliformis geosporum]
MGTTTEIKKTNIGDALINKECYVCKKKITEKDVCEDSNWGVDFDTSNEWEKEVTNLVGGEKSEKELKKGEIKPDGTLVTAESEKIKTNDFELLLGQIKYQKELIKTKKDELAKKHGYADEAKQILKEIKELEPKTILNTYLQSKYKKVANTSPSETNNTTATEDYVIKLITRTVKELGAIDYDKFVTHTNSNTHPLSTSASEIDKAEFTASKLQGYLKVIQDRAKNLVDNKIKSDNHPDKGKPANGHRIEYSFGQDFTKSGTNTPQDSANFTETELIVKNDTLIVLPAKSNPMNKSDFTNFTPEDLGIPVDSSGKSNFYATDYGTKISDEEEDKVEYRHSDYTNRQKLISSFTNDPVRQLFADIRTYVHKDNSLKTDKDGSGTSTPDYACFASLLEGVKTGRESLKAAEKALAEAKKELVKKKKEVESKITEKITELRKKYLENFNENTPSSVNNEELARQALVDLQAEIFTKRDETNKIYLVRYFRDGEGRTEIEKIESFEKSFGSQAKWVVHTLQEVVTDDAGKYLEDADLTEEEIKTILYELAEGKKTLASEKKADETNGDDTGNPTDKMSIAKE